MQEQVCKTKQETALKGEAKTRTPGLVIISETDFLFNSLKCIVCVAAGL